MGRNLIGDRFRYQFLTEDGKVRTIMIEDWEIYMLYRNCLELYHDRNVALQKVKAKYMSFADKDTYFFMGTSFQWHMKKAPDPYLIIGVCPATKHAQLVLDL